MRLRHRAGKRGAPAPRPARLPALRLRSGTGKTAGHPAHGQGPARLRRGHPRPPVWAGRLSSPMRSYIHANAGRFRRLAAFCTMGGSGGETVLDEVAALCGKPLVARLVLSDTEIRQDRDRDKLGLFVRGAAAAPG